MKVYICKYDAIEDEDDTETVQTPREAHCTYIDT